MAVDEDCGGKGQRAGLLDRWSKVGSNFEYSETTVILRMVLQFLNNIALVEKSRHIKNWIDEKN